MEDIKVDPECAADASRRRCLAQAEEYMCIMIDKFAPANGGDPDLTYAAICRFAPVCKISKAAVGHFEKHFPRWEEAQAHAAGHQLSAPDGSSSSSSSSVLPSEAEPVCGSDVRDTSEVQHPSAEEARLEPTEDAELEGVVQVV
jgi:hypothetical protein